MFDGVPAYLGGKRKLLGTIFRELAKAVDSLEWRDCSFVDGFTGGGSVSIYAKAQFREVLSNDYSDRSAMIAQAILANNDVRLSRADCVLLMEGAESATNWCATQPDWFIPGTAKAIDRGLAYADSVGNPTKAALLRLLAWRFVCLSRPSSGDFTSRNLVDRAMDGELKNTGVVSAKYAFRPPNIRDALHWAEITNRSVFRGNLRFEQRDAITASEDWGADIVYIDPPYAGDSAYETFYRMADSAMAQAEIPKGGGVSPFSDRKTAEDAIGTVIANVYRAGARVLIASNSDEAIPRDRHLAIFEQIGWKAYEAPVKHRHSIAARRGVDNAAAGMESGASEVLIVATR